MSNSSYYDPKDPLGDYQGITHKSSRSLNEMLKDENTLSAIDSFMDELPNLENFEFVEKDGNSVEIQIAHERFLDYLRARMGQSSW